MKITKIGIALGCLMLLDACTTAPPNQNNKSTVRGTVPAGWRAVHPAQTLSNVYWARLQKLDARYVVTEVSNTSLKRANLSEEIIVFDSERKFLRPAFAETGDPPKIETSRLCNKKQMETPEPYTVCNSAFSGTTGASIAFRVIFGVGTLGQTELMRNGRSFLDYLPDTLTAAIDGAAIEALLPAAIEKRRLSNLMRERVADERRRAEQADREAQRERERREEENKKAAVANTIRALSALPKGYKDVCEYNFVALREAGTLEPNTSELTCINFGTVPAGLSSLKTAGFLVTNITERKPGERSSSRFNVERSR